MQRSMRNLVRAALPALAMAWRLPRPRRRPRRPRSSPPRWPCRCGSRRRPGDDRVFVVEQDGLIKVFDRDGTSRGVFLDITGAHQRRRRARPARPRLRARLRRRAGVSTSTTPTSPATPGWRATASAPIRDRANPGSAQILLTVDAALREPQRRPPRLRPRRHALHRARRWRQRRRSAEPRAERPVAARQDAAPRRVRRRPPTRSRRTIPS